MIHFKLYAFAISFHPFLHPHPNSPVMFKTHQCCRSPSCQIGLRWGSMYHHCRRNTTARFKTLVSVIGKLSCHTSWSTRHCNGDTQSTSIQKQFQFLENGQSFFLYTDTIMKLYVCLFLSVCVSFCTFRLSPFTLEELNPLLVFFDIKQSHAVP